LSSNNSSAGVHVPAHFGTWVVAWNLSCSRELFAQRNAVISKDAVISKNA
jgi:hypothetical protein